MNQNPRYVTEPLTFNQLNFAQFVGGEARTIVKTTDPVEIFGRLRVLSKVAYLKDQCKSWDKARAVYFAIVSSIEEGEATWNSSFAHYDLMCPAVPEKVRSDTKFATNFGRKQTQKRDLYCREFQKGECNVQPPHKSWIRNNYEMVEHFCFPCYKEKMGKVAHVPGSERRIQK